MQTVYLIEDDEVIAQSVKKYLETWGMKVECAQDFNCCYEEFERIRPSIVLLDITLPFFNGYHWCTKIRQNSKVPIVFISGNNDNMSIVMAMNMGGDDFITKPFDLNVLYAKLQATLRRAYELSGNESLLEHRGLVMNLSEMTLRYHDTRIDLTKNEYKILQVLMESVGKVVEREQLMEHLWESESFVDDNTLTVNITRLRKKLEDAGLTEFIATRKGVGYLIVAQES